MTALDAAFWDFEDENCPLHIGGVAVFDGPVPSSDEMAAVYARAIANNPRYRRRMRRLPMGLGRPVWVTDPTYDPDHHLRRTALPAPGGEAELSRLVSRLMSLRLDTGRPPWEAWVVEGLAGGRWALLIKLHHSMVDGLGAVELFSAMLDPHDGRVGGPPGLSPETSRLTWSIAALAQPLGAMRQVARDVAAAGLRPQHTSRVAREILGGLIGTRRLLRPTRPSSLSGAVGARRRYRMLTADLADVSAIRTGFGGSVNDVVLAAAARGFRALLAARGEHPAATSVRSLVPVSTRTDGSDAGRGNAVSALFVDLPVDFDDVVETYEAMKARMAGLKASHEADAARFGVGVADLVPAPLAAWALRAVRRVPQRLVTTVVTNVPGPRTPMSLLGRRMEALFPYVPIADRVRVGIAVSSYAGRLQFGLTADSDSVPDLDVFVAGIDAGLADLVKRAHDLTPEAGQ